MRKNDDFTQLKIEVEKVLEKLASLEKIFSQAIEHIEETTKINHYNTECKLLKIEKSLEEHGKRIGELEKNLSKFIGAATLAGALTGTITGIILKLIFK